MAQVIKLKLRAAWGREEGESELCGSSGELDSPGYEVSIDAKKSRMSSDSAILFSFSSNVSLLPLLGPVA